MATVMFSSILFCLTSSEKPPKYWDSFFFFFLKDVVKCLRDLRRDRLATTGWYGKKFPQLVAEWFLGEFVQLAHKFVDQVTYVKPQ